jgi:hypothetical protein
MVAPRIDGASAEQAAATLAAKIQSQTATPGSEAARQRLIESIAAGKPNYSEVSPELANVTREQLPKLKAAVDYFGSVQSTGSTVLEIRAGISTMCNMSAAVCNGASRSRKMAGSPVR